VQEGHAVAVGSLDTFYFFSGNFGGENARASRQGHFQEWLCLVFDGESYFG
jgi:hypothetical protein